MKPLQIVSDVDIPFFLILIHIDILATHIDIVDIISPFFLFKWILGPLQNAYFHVKSIVGF